MQVVPEALHRGGVASGARSGALVACTGRTDLDWVPDREAPVVPDPQRRLCRSCPARAACLTQAVATRSVGYWAGSTTADRQALTDIAGPLLPVLDAYQDQLAQDAAATAAADQAKALHAAGEGGLWWYRRRGCRCAECRAANAAHRAAGRARAACRAPVAA